MRTLRLSILLLLGFSWGCGQAHLSDGFGKANQQALAMQKAPLATRPVPTNMSLDTQEAGVITDVYLRSLAGKTRVSGEPDPVLYVAPPPRQGAQQPLAPSVPRN
jgi:hypothetical protein